MSSFFKYVSKFPSVAIIIFICLTVIEVHLNLIRYAQKTVIAWDIVGYYSYLPATFIEKDLKLKFITTENTPKYKGVKYAYSDDAKGNHIIKYSMGMAIMYAPFFLIAHTLAEPLGYTPDGYSAIYHWCIEYSGLFYLMIGLLFLRKLLLMYYSENITALSLFVIFFGTNLLCYATLDAAMSHTYTFSLFAILLYTIVNYYKTPKLSYALCMALLLGLIILIRPINILLIVAIVFFGINTRTELKDRFIFFRVHYLHIILFSVLLFLVVLPQFLYWKYVTGNFMVFSYAKEGFYFLQPHIIDCLIGFRKGWLIYSPVFIFSIYGISLLKKQASSGFFTMHLILLPVYIYTISSWWCWWYGGSFGLRPMIDLYPLLTIALTACIFKLNTLHKLKKNIFFGILFFLVALNIFQTFQYKYNIIHYDAMTARSYINVFGKMDKEYIDTTLLNHPDYEKALRGLNN